MKFTGVTAFSLAAFAGIAAAQYNNATANGINGNQNGNAGQSGNNINGIGNNNNGDCNGVDNCNISNGIAYVTEVVQSFTTYCPGNTAFTYNGQAYTATGPGVVTVTNCPCTVTKALHEATATATGDNHGQATANPVSGGGNNVTSPSQTPEPFTGGAAAGKMVAVSGALAAGIAGSLFFL